MCVCEVLLECFFFFNEVFKFFFFVLRCSAYYFKHIIVMSKFLVAGCWYM